MTRTISDVFGRAVSERRNPCRTRFREERERESRTVGHGDTVTPARRLFGRRGCAVRASESSECPRTPDSASPLAQGGGLSCCRAASLRSQALLSGCVERAADRPAAVSEKSEGGVSFRRVAFRPGSKALAKRAISDKRRDAITPAVLRVDRKNIGIYKGFNMFIHHEIGIGSSSATQRALLSVAASVWPEVTRG